jgi:ABC-type Fe3+/spermidine/putrescine transport system ATPase subunit
VSLLEVKKLSYRYDPRKSDGIKDISFGVHKGEIVSLIGPSGSGKTTTLKCISGKIKTQGVHIAEKVSISVIDQSPTLIENKTVFENLENQIIDLLDPLKRENQIRTTLALIEITNEIDSLVHQLSGGQRQRLVLAMALVTNPTLLLLDEPFAHLDKGLRRLLLEELWHIFREKEITVVWVTHSTEEALKYSDKMVLLNYGEVQQIGHARDLFFKPNNIFVAQFFGENNILAAKKLTDKSFSFLNKETILNSALPKEEDFLAVLRPQFFHIDSHSKLSAIVKDIAFQGSTLLLQTDIDGVRVYIELPSHMKFSIGEKISVNFLADHITLLNQS